MTLNDLKKIKPIPGFDCVKMKHRAQSRIHEETKDMTPEELVEFFQSKAETRAAHPETVSLVLNEDPPKN